MQKKSLIKNRAATKKALLARKSTKLSGNTKGTKIAGAAVGAATLNSAANTALSASNAAAVSLNASTASAANTSLSMSQVGLTNSVINTSKI